MNILNRGSRNERRLVILESSRLLGPLVGLDDVGDWQVGTLPEYYEPSEK